MPKFNEDALDAAVNKSAMKVSVDSEEVEMQPQTIIRNIPKPWINAVKNKAHATLGGYMKAALREKLERDGLI
jgi:hypothetical protein